jgi:hypothetical protein
MMPDVFSVLKQDHDEVKAMLARLEDGPTAASGATAEQLTDRKRLVDDVIIAQSGHESAEQRYFWPALEAHAWPLLSASIDARQAAQLGDQISQAKKTGPTRPHPAVPPRAAPRRAASPVAGAADRLRDMVSGRGQHRED